jgi:hypothetical protein
MTGDTTDATTIAIDRTDVENLLSRFQVRLTDADGTSTDHEVTLSRADWERFGVGYRTPEELIEAAFLFLLEREPKEQILAAFDLAQITRYFPSFGRDISRRA